MSESEIKEFFECLGEIWRDITLVEFLMRASIARKAGEIKKFPTEFTKGKTYKDYPKIFQKRSFSKVVSEFNKYFPEFKIPQELIDLRNAMAHGFIAEINKSGADQLIKLKKHKNDILEVEFSMPLEKQRIDKIRQLLKKIRRDIGKKADDNQS